VTLLDEVLPRWDVRERHRVALAAAPGRALAAAKAVRLEELPAARALFRLRGLGSSGTVLEAMLAAGFEVVAEREGELVVAAVGRPWRLIEPLRRGVDVRAFAEPGYARLAMDLRADGSTLSTETRVQLTDAAARRAFRAYWLLVRPWSGLTRRLWLRAAARNGT
jgi:hypothetical protein